MYDAGMQEFINLAKNTLGMTEQTARDATAQVLNVVASMAPAADVQQLISRIPGAAELLKAVQPAPPPAPPATETMLGGLGDLVSTALTAAQGAVGGGVALMSALGHAGLDPGKAATFVKLFVDFARQYAGTDLVDRVVGSLPGVKQFLQ